jgi:hypothetical protein
VELLVEHATADPTRLHATAEAVRAKYAELIAAGRTGDRTRRHLIATRRAAERVPQPSAVAVWRRDL